MKDDSIQSKKNCNKNEVVFTAGRFLYVNEVIIW